MSIDRGWIKKMWGVCVCVCVCVCRNTTHPLKAIIMSFAATWMDLESVILSEISQKEKKKYHMTSLIGGI